MTSQTKDWVGKMGMTHRANNCDIVSVTCQFGTSSIGKNFKCGVGFYEGELIKIEAERKT